MLQLLLQLLILLLIFAVVVVVALVVGVVVVNENKANETDNLDIFKKNVELF